MAFRYDGKDIQTALGQGVDNKLTRPESPVALAYEQGTPMRLPNRFAGSELANSLGMAGEFGASTKDPNMKRYFKEFTSYLEGGPFASNGPFGEVIG